MPSLFLYTNNIYDNRTTTGNFFYLCMFMLYNTIYIFSNDAMTLTKSVLSFNYITIRANFCILNHDLIDLFRSINHTIKGQSTLNENDEIGPNGLKPINDQRSLMVNLRLQILYACRIANISNCTQRIHKTLRIIYYLFNLYYYVLLFIIIRIPLNTGFF